MQMQYRSKAIVRQPTGKFGLFDASIPMFVWDNIDFDQDFHQDFHQVQQFMGHIGSRLLRAEIEFARQDVSWDDEEWTAHPEGLSRWERALELMIGHRGLDDTMTLLREANLDRFPLHARALAVAAWKELQDEQA
jgi:hypothetical protein